MTKTQFSCVCTRIVQLKYCVSPTSPVISFRYLTYKVTITMDYHVEVLPTHILVTVQGKVKRPDDSRKLMEIFTELLERESCNVFLFDLQEAQIETDDSSSYAAGIMPAIKGLPEREWRVAILYKQVSSQDRMMESLFSQYGYLVRVFDDRDEAIAWLL